MRKILKEMASLLPIISLCLLCSGCVFAFVKTPLDTDVSVTELGSKVGESHSQSILWLVAWGDAGSAAAAKDGQITTLKHMDREILSILGGLYTKVTTIVYGD